MIKMHQGESYQNFIKLEGYFRSFLYNKINLRAFSLKTCSLNPPLQLRLKE